MLLVFSSNFILTSCSKDEPLKSENDSLKIDDETLTELEIKLASDPTYMNFLTDIVTIYNSMFYDCVTDAEVQKKVEKVLQLTENENLEANPKLLKEFYTQIGYEDEESFLAINNRLLSSKKQLIQKYPEIIQLNQDEATRIFTNSVELKKTQLYNLNNSQNLKNTSYSDCQYCVIDYLTCGGIGWVTAAMCVLGCTATGPFVIPCAIGCTLLLIGGVSLECNGSLRECNQNYNCGFNLPF